jgi:hypothetical protein
MHKDCTNLQDYYNSTKVIYYNIMVNNITSYSNMYHKHATSTLASTNRQFFVEADARSPLLIGFGAASTNKFYRGGYKPEPPIMFISGLPSNRFVPETYTIPKTYT